MKIFISKYWQINILVFIILECMGIIGISSMCIPDLKEGRIDIISLAYGLGAVALAAFLLFRMRNVMQYVIIGSGYAVTHTATGKTVCQVCLDKPFYCIVVTLVVAVGSTQQFILLSNDTIDVDLILSINLKRFMRSGSPGKNELIMWRIVKPPKLTPWAMGRASPVCSV